MSLSAENLGVVHAVAQPNYVLDVFFDQMTSFLLTLTILFHTPIDFWFFMTGVV